MLDRSKDAKTASLAPSSLLDLLLLAFCGARLVDLMPALESKLGMRAMGTSKLEEVSGKLMSRSGMARQTTVGTGQGQAFASFDLITR